MTAYERKPKCPSGCNSDERKETSNGTYLICTVCDNIVTRVYERTAEECEHDGPMDILITKQGKNAGKQYSKCTLCGDFCGFIDAPKETVGEKRARSDIAQASLEDLEAKLTSMENILHKIAAKILVPSTTQ